MTKILIFIFSIISATYAHSFDSSQYIVKVKNGSSVNALLKLIGLQNAKKYRYIFKGFSARLNSNQINLLRKNSAVSYLEQNKRVTPVYSQNVRLESWSLDRIDQKSNNLDGDYDYRYTGKNVHAFIIDTGIKKNHKEFQGRVSNKYFDAFGDKGEDCNGHGTHVAGSVGGKTYGVAKDVKLYAVRVLGCDGSGSSLGIINGVEWVIKNKKESSVANLSLGMATRSRAVDDAVKALSKNGITAVVAAGNDNLDACNSSPAAEKTAITVGASDKSDYKASFSNWGDCVDIFAPGTQIKSAWHTSSNATNTIQGTSMAAPHVAGIAAKYLEKFPGAKPSEVADSLNKTSRKGIVKNSLSNDNNLANSNIGEKGEEDDDYGDDDGEMGLPDLGDTLDPIFGGGDDDDDDDDSGSGKKDDGEGSVIPEPVCNLLFGC